MTVINCSGCFCHHTETGHNRDGTGGICGWGIRTQSCTFKVKFFREQK